MISAELVLVLAEVGLEIDLDAAILEDLHGGGRESVGNENAGSGHGAPLKIPLPSAGEGGLASEVGRGGAVHVDGREHA